MVKKFIAENRRSDSKYFDFLIKILKASDKNFKESDLYFLSDLYDEQDKESFENSIDESKLEDFIKDADILMCFGPKALDYLTGVKTITKAINSEFEFKGIKLIPNYSPILLMHNDSYKEVFVNNINKMFLNSEKEKTQFKIINSIQEFTSVINYIKESGVFCFDFETSGLEWHINENYPTLLSITFNAGFSYILPLYHKESPFGELDMDYFFVAFKLLIEDPNIIKVGHNLKFDLLWMKHYVNFDKAKGQCIDTMLCAHLLDETRPKGLKELVKIYHPEYSGYEIKDYNIELQQLAQYAAIDSDMTYRLYVQFTQELLNDDEDSRLYIYLRNISSPAVSLFVETEFRGMLIDKNKIQDGIEFCEKVLEDLEHTLRNFKEIKIYEQHNFNRQKEKAREKLLDNISRAKGKRLENYNLQLNELESNFQYEPLNFASTQQLGNFIYSDEGLGKPEFYDSYEKKFTRSTSQEALQEVDHPFVVELTAFRSVSKMLSTYYKSILEKTDDFNYLHASFNLAGTVTGRLSSSDPNMQNIPVRTKSSNPNVQEVIYKIKEFFIAPENQLFVEYDYSQAELRMIANFSGDETMIDSYMNDKDIHSITAAKLLKISIEDFNKLDKDKINKSRTMAKGANFGLVYGATVDTYVEYVKTQYGIKISKKEGEEHKKAFFDTYKQLKKWHEIYIAKAKKYGYVRTLFGRKRRLENIHSTNPSLRSQDERYAINSPIQGSSGEWTIFSIILICKILDIEFINTIHDAKYFYMVKDLFEKNDSIIKELSTYPFLDEFFQIEKPEVLMKLDMNYSDENWRKNKRMKVYIDISQIIKANWYIKNKIGSSRSLSKLVDDNIGNIIFEISKQYKVSDIILAEDSKTYFRKSLYPLYKGHRIVDESYNDLKSKTILDLREIYNHKVYEGLEADDIMYLETKDNPGIIVSSDQDLRQTNQIIFNPVSKLKVIYSYTNKDLILKIIRGCASDNVPALINRFRSDLVHPMDPIRETCLQFVTEKEYSLNYELVVFDMTTYLKYVDLKNYKK